MSETTLCFSTICVCLVFIIIYTVIWKMMGIGGPSIFERADKAMKLFKSATTTRETLYAIGLGIGVVLKGGTGLLMSFLILIVSVLPAAACNISVPEVLRDLVRELRLLISELSSSLGSPVGLEPASRND